jgi:hypothetical protein
MIDDFHHIPWPQFVFILDFGHGPFIHGILGNPYLRTSGTGIRQKAYCHNSEDRLYISDHLFT